MIGYKECLNIMSRSRNILAMEPITQKPINDSDPDYENKNNDF